MYKSIMGQNSHRSCHSFYEKIGREGKSEREGSASRERARSRELGTGCGNWRCKRRQMKHVLVLSHLLTTPRGRFAGRWSRRWQQDGCPSQSVSEIKQCTAWRCLWRHQAASSCSCSSSASPAAALSSSSKQPHKKIILCMCVFVCVWVSVCAIRMRVGTILWQQQAAGGRRGSEGHPWSGGSH